MSEEKKETERYVSKDGFVGIPTVRGVDQITAILEDTSYYGGFILGGYARYCCSPRARPIPPNDIDIYCPTQRVYDDLKTKFIGIGLKVEKENDISIRFDDRFTEFEIPLQLIKPIKVARIVTEGNMETMLDNFDFTVVRIGLFDLRGALADADFMHDEQHTLLRIKNIHCPISSTMRIAKYAKKGYYAPPFQILRLFLDWDNRDEDYRAKLTEFIRKADEDGETLTEEEVNEMEAMMRID